MSETLYNVEKILDRRKVNGKFEYKIKWEGYPMNQSTWEPMENLETVKELVEEYNRAYPITDKKSSSKASSHKKISDKFINKKRKEKNDEINGQINQNVKISEEPKIISDINSKVNEKENAQENLNANKQKFIIDDSLKNVVTVKQKNERLVAVVDKLESNGEINKIYIPTEELRKTNPWILLNFYESKIKFS